MREDILKAKLEKLENLRNVGVDPYPEKSQRTHSAFGAFDGRLCFCTH
ncbi:MAG: hypothetical protein UR65_C0085G0001 [Candidatus Moranbacteria bacterium GW2011_GWE2_35_164]|nr:MAG: hypothetical protein UR65_C0085G0001 [Candidatus Moranbacteria bacterium GW2011_GWE2_35_164]